MPSTTCPGCECKLRAPAGADGRKIRCPSCHATLLVSDGELTLFQPDGPSRGVRRARPDDDEPIRRPRRSNEDEPEEDEDRPTRRPRRRRGKGRVPVWAWVGGGVVAAVAVIGLIVLLLNKKDPYDRVEIGMSEKEVKDLLGEPVFTFDLSGFGGLLAGAPFGGEAARDMASRKQCFWEKKNEVIIIAFKDGKVETKDRQKIDTSGGGRPSFDRFNSGGHRPDPIRPSGRRR